MIFVIDNYDSFTYNLVQYLGELTNEPLEVVRNDKITTMQLREKHPSRIIISPGPGRPENAGITVETIRQFYQMVPILGICLGHQAIGYALGGKVIKAKELKHGKTSEIYHDNNGLFKGLANPFVATRYHSLVVESDSLPEDLKVTAWTEDKTIMGIRHVKYPVEGLQFHPESILTEVGKKILARFLEK